MKSNNLNKHVTKTATKWKKVAQENAKNRRSITRAQQFALDLMDYMDDHNISQKKLAMLMDVSPQQVNKILRAKANLTFDTIDKIEDALEIEISTPKIISKSSKLIETSMVYTTMKVVHNANKLIEIDYTSATPKSKAPQLETTIESMDEYLTAFN